MTTSQHSVDDTHCNMDQHQYQKMSTDLQRLGRELEQRRSRPRHAVQHDNGGEHCHLERWENRGYIREESQEEEDGEPMDWDASSKSRRLTQKLPSRCSSEPLDYNHAAPSHRVEDRGNELLEDWPHLASSADAADWHSLCRCLGDAALLVQSRKQVTFSERSSMHVYRLDPSYAATKSYGREERKSFGTAALREAIRIKRLVIGCTPTDGTSTTKDAFKHLLKNNVIALEEIVGIEHMVLGKSASKLLRERQDHSRAILLEQRRMECSRRGSKTLEGNDTCETLGRFSALRSSKSVKRARIRAAMAA